MRRVLVGVALAVTLAACKPADRAATTAAQEPAGAVPRVPASAPLRELERLAFVPRGRSPREAALPVVGSEVDLLVDRFEVTRALFREVLPETAPPWGAGPEGDLPATHLDLATAEACAAQRGMRLPTTTEWLWLAVGPRGSPYPYTRVQDSIANMKTRELDLGRPVPVGTFENGRTPDTGLYDLHGNVRELALVRAVDGSVRAYAAGGSFETPASPTFGRAPQDFVLLDPVDPAAQLDDVGVRCVAPAREWLLAHAGALSRPEWRPAIVAVGARWGPRAAPLLVELAAEFAAGGDAAAPALAWLAEGAR